MIDGGIDTYRKREAMSDVELAECRLRRIAIRYRDSLSNSGYHRQGLCFWTAETDCGRSVYIGSIRGDVCPNVTAYVPLTATTVRLRVGHPRRGKKHDHIDVTVALDEAVAA